MPQSITPARRLAIIAQARISGAVQAAETGSVGVRTVRRWLEEEGAEQHDEQEWAAARGAAQEGHLSALLRGETRGIGGWATSAGVSARNQRYARLIRRRGERLAAQEQPPQPARPNADRLAEAVAATPWEVKRLAAALIDAAHDADTLPSAADADMTAEAADGMIAWLQQLATLDPAERDRLTAEADAVLSARWEADGGSALPTSEAEVSITPLPGTRGSPDADRATR